MEIQSISLAGNWETSGLLGQGLLSLFIYLFIFFFFSYLFLKILYFSFSRQPLRAITRVHRRTTEQCLEHSRCFISLC